MHLRFMRMLAAFKQLTGSTSSVDIGLTSVIGTGCDEEVHDFRHIQRNNLQCDSTPFVPA